DVTFTYQATDPHGAISNQATVTMTVIGANVVPDSDECPVPPPSVLAGYDYSAGSGGGDTIDRSGSYGDDSLLCGQPEDTLEGGAGNDQLFGGNGQDTVSGNDGDDTIDGGNGEETLDGGAGNDNNNGGVRDDQH